MNTEDDPSRGMVDDFQTDDKKIKEKIPRVEG